MTDGQKLVAFLNRMMGCDDNDIIDHTIVKDATNEEIDKHCKKGACKNCAILQRCQLAEQLYK